MAQKKKKTPAHAKPPRRRRWPWVVFGLFLFLGLAGLGGLYAGYMYFSYDLPKLDKLSDYRPKAVTKFLADDGSLMAEFFEERREVAPLQRMPANLINAFVAAEDAAFFEHQGINLWAIARAAIRNLEAGRLVQGGSTITQQVTKSFLLTPEKSFKRKIREAILAYKIDRRFTKQEILYLYLNQIYLGEGTYGVQAAAQTYFGKDVDQLSLAQCAMLAGLPQAPSRYSPRTHPERARRRQIYVLNRMAEEGFITPQEARDAARETVAIQPRRPRHFFRAPYYVEHVRRLIEEKYGHEALMIDGLKVYTACNLYMQQSAEEAIMTGLRDLDKREGWRGPVEHLDQAAAVKFVEELAKKVRPEMIGPGQILAGVVVQVEPKKAEVHLGQAQAYIDLKDAKWARTPNPNVPYYVSKLKDLNQALKVGDVILVKLVELTAGGKWKAGLEQDPAAQSALVCMESATGEVKSLVGGRDYAQSQFNRATQANRQPGSAFKPLLYSAALDKGLTASSIILDAPVVYHLAGTDKPWKPTNYSKKFYGPTTFRVGLEKSRNVVMVKILEQIGVEYGIEYAKRLGITSPVQPNLSIALGSNSATPLEMARAYATFCNNGLKTDPIFIRRIEDRNGKVIEESQLKRTRVISPETAYIITHILEGVIQNGTGHRIKALGRPAAGKTGTTNDLRDAWFVGYTPDLVTAVWVGYDDFREMGRGETGSRAASPIWLDFMQRATANRPPKAFKPPENVVFARVDHKTGLLAAPGDKDSIMEAYKPGTAPTAYASQPKPADSDFLKQDM